MGSDSDYKIELQYGSVGLRWNFSDRIRIRTFRIESELVFFDPMQFTTVHCPSGQAWVKQTLGFAQHMRILLERNKIIWVRQNVFRTFPHCLSHRKIEIGSSGRSQVGSVRLEISRDVDYVAGLTMGRLDGKEMSFRGNTYTYQIISISLEREMCSAAVVHIVHFPFVQR